MLNNESNNNLKKLIVGAIGVVFGDIGTSPLYTIKDCLSESHYPMDNILIMGILSLIFWSITIIVTLKYVCVILMADNNGEGGVLSLLSLNLRSASDRTKGILFGIGAIGAALFYGDAVITPAISVLSAVEGLTVVSPDLTGYVIPSAVVILFVLFFIQEKGTESIGRLFGPAMLIWFLLLAGLGVNQIYQKPEILKALNPWYAYHFFDDHGFFSLGILGSIVLAITGAEALYTDLGHFGKDIIRRAWLFIVFPALILNYFGQGALLIGNHDAVSNPFFFLVPSWASLPLVIVATLATTIASQAVISGIFSMTWQAVQLGYLPRMLVHHTSRKTIGQVFVPTMNWSLLVCAIILVITFKSSTNLASAYGMAVTGIMVITTTMIGYLAWSTWKWPLWRMVVVFGVFGIVDFSFFSVNLLKFSEGGWIPFCVGVSLWAVMTTWVEGKRVLNDRIFLSGKTLNNFSEKIRDNPPVRIPGIAVYMSSSPDNEPTSLTINFKHNKVLHEKVVLLSILTLDVPRVHKSARLSIADFGMNIYQVIVHIGYMEKPNIPSIFEHCDELGLHLDIHETSFFMSRGIPISSTTPHMMAWRERLFIWLAKNAMNATEFYKIPHKRVVELGIRLKM